MDVVISNDRSTAGGGVHVLGEWKIQMSIRLIILSTALTVLMFIALAAFGGPAIGSTSEWGIVISPCAWCGRTNDIEIHHIWPQRIAPERAHDKSNMICLCRECHYVLGHRKNWTNSVTNLVIMIFEGKK